MAATACARLICSSCRESIGWVKWASLESEVRTCCAVDLHGIRLRSWSLQCLWSGLVLFLSCLCHSSGVYVQSGVDLHGIGVDLHGIGVDLHALRIFYGICGIVLDALQERRRGAEDLIAAECLIYMTGVWPRVWHWNEVWSGRGCSTDAIQNSTVECLRCGCSLDVSAPCRLTRLGFCDPHELRDLVKNPRL